MLTADGPIAPTDPRIAEEIERRVAERTAELSAISEDLRRQLSERHRDHENPHLREILLKSFIDGIGAPVTLCAPTGEMVAVNRFGQEYHRKSVEEIMDWTSGEMIFAADLPRVKAAWQRSIETGEPYDVEVRARRAHGPYRWMRLHGFPVRDSDGSILRWCVLHLDIHDSKSAEEALAASERNLKLTINTMPAMAWTADTSGNVEFFNDNFLDYVGLPLDRMLDDSWKQAVHPDDVDDLLETWKVVMAAGRTGETEARLRRFDGTYRWFLMRVSPLRDESGKVVRWYGINTDVDAWRQTERQRQQAEDSLRASELMLGSMLDSIAAPIGFFNSDGELEAVNHLVGDYFGKSFEEVSQWENIVHPDDLVASQAAWQRAIETGAAYEHEARIRRADGEYRWNDHRGYPMRDAEGRIVRWCVLQIDIHDRKQAEARLAASERNLDQIISGIPGLAWTALPDGHADFLNQHYLDYVGLSLEQARGVGWMVALHPDDLEHLIADWRAMMSERRGGESEARIRRYDGEYRCFLFRASPVLDDAGNVVRWFGVNTDIEDLKRAEAAMRASELNLRQLTETIPQMLWSATADGSIDYCNKRLLEFTGFTPEEAMGTGWAKMLHPDDVEPTVRAWLHCIATGDPYRVEVRTLRASDQTYRWLLTSALPLRDTDGRILKWHGACADMHDWKQAQDELRDAQAELAHMTRVMTMGHLTASIAHELNQPLAGIITNASTCLRMLAADPPNVTGARETARRTIRDGNRAADVIARLRSLFSKKDPVIEAVDVNTATQEVIALTLTELKKANVSLRVQLAEALPSVEGDRVQLQQVIMNLILNAMQAMDGIADRSKELVVATERDGCDAVRVVIQDAGVGFEAAIAEKLFHPFYTTKRHGMGIGLSVSRSIVENHQGRLWAERNDGPGATFIVSIPSGDAGDGAEVNA
ncbi:PAS domain-containing protein [Mesorhizobium sp. BR115XR7A]|uniref:PAS domain-containing sensor histidine kinase n=1 Tax=Mesorhizobium sp. BR115XR7A TaxID=2876645 RepID=UPI001CD02794|nr:PAS domain-containing sensor histidine kinase [Mesorhizobium sp. BR115XR7A]MBZ9905504.1 PAS domain-containing protein [Mesorhizobium sp. BR115XR7A]MBZ9931036.1 PAS domain-containing protein [Mesorhizobium sp. BR1-1-5]